jgi:hypothetical protein
VDIQWNAYIDWDCTDWAGTHDFNDPPEARTYDDISEDVLLGSPIISGTVNRDEAVYPAKTCELLLRNDTGKYFLNNPESVLYGRIRLWLPVCVIATFNSVPYPRFYGYINRITYYPIKDKQTAYFYATDGTDLLAKTIVVQDMDDKLVKTDGEACDDILTAAGWNAARRIIDLDGGDIVNFPDTFAFMKGA